MRLKMRKVTLRNRVLSYLCMVFILLIGINLTGCGNTVQEDKMTMNNSAENTSIEDCKTSEVNGKGTIAEESTEENTTEVNTIVSDWEVRTEKKPEFPVHFEAYHTKDFGIAIGKYGEIHYTTDAGKEWPNADNKSNCCYGMDFVNDDVIYVSCNYSHVIKSIDGGRTFTRLSDFGGETPHECRYVSFVDELTGMIAADNKIGLTTDGGQNWNEIVPPCEIIGIYMESAQDIYLVGKDLFMYVSTDGGQTWNHDSLGLPEGEDYLNLKSNVVFCVKEDGIKLFAIQKSTKLLKYYETERLDGEWTEYELPDVKGNRKLYLNKSCDVISALGDTDMAIIYKK